jgi:aminoglycoside phosphotransferase (APT) family kinase protein
MQPLWTAEHEVDATLARQLVTSQFAALADSRALSIERLGAGWDNVAFLVTAEQGQFVFRFPRRTIAASLIETETRLLPALARRLPLPIPVPIFAGRPGPAFPWPFSGYRRLAGRSACGAALDGDARARAAAPLGRFLRALHALPVEEMERLQAPCDTLGRAALDSRIPQARERLGEAGDRGLLPAILDDDARRRLQAICDEAEADRALDGAAQPRALVHGDLYARHLLVGGDRQLCGVIDWGDLHIGHPGVDLSVAFAFLPAPARTSFFEAYGGVPAAAVLRLARLRALFSLSTLLLYGSQTGDADLVDEAARGLEHLLIA